MGKILRIEKNVIVTEEEIPRVEKDVNVT